jgi:hypothetical protein
MLYNKKIKPSLVDKNIIHEYIQNSVKIGGSKESKIYEITTKVFNNIISFIYHYFFIIVILGLIIYYLYNRYYWYQDIKKINEQKMIQYQKVQPQQPPQLQQLQQIPQQLPQRLPQQIQQQLQQQIQQIPQQLQQQLEKQLQPQQLEKQLQKQLEKQQVYEIPNFNDRYRNHLTHAFDTLQPIRSSMGHIKPIIKNMDNFSDGKTVKTVKFAQGDFDAYGRNHLNPKTGETLMKNIIY